MNFATFMPLCIGSLDSTEVVCCFLLSFSSVFVCVWEGGGVMKGLDHCLVFQNAENVFYLGPLFLPSSHDMECNKWVVFEHLRLCSVLSPMESA